MQINAGAGASNEIFKHEQPKNPNRSRFDISRIINLTCDSGMIIPFDWFKTLPGDSLDLEAEIAVESLPTITNVLTPYKVKTHWYYVRMSDLWEGWETFITKGRTGNIELEIPKIKTNVRTKNKNNKDCSYETPHSLQSYIGVPPTLKESGEPTEGEYTTNYLPYVNVTDGTPTATGYEEPTYVSALPFMAYQAIVKYNYVDQNLLQGNTALFPEKGDSEWRIPYNWDAESNGYITTTDGTNNLSGWEPNGIFEDTDTKVGLQCLRYAPFEDDYFTSGLPWQQRGSIKTLQANLNIENIQIQTKNALSSVSANILTIGVDPDDPDLNMYGVPVANGKEVGSYTPPTYSIKAYDGYQLREGEQLYTRITGEQIAQTLKGKFNGATNLGITANQLRELIAMSVWQERNARVNGSYNTMIWVHYNKDPKANEHYPIFLGGTSDYINFTQITQTSETQTTPQGTVNSLGQLYSGQKIGRFECPDYGIIMGIMIITPMTTYNTSIEHHLICENVMEDYEFPEFEQLGPQPILNGEIFTSASDTTNKGLFAYQERYAYDKTRQNVNRGLFRLPSDSDILFSSASQSREFATTPKFSYQFVTQSPDNTRRDWLAYESEPMFKVQVASKIDAVRPLSYQSKPNNFGF